MASSRASGHLPWTPVFLLWRRPTPIPISVVPSSSYVPFLRHANGGGRVDAYELIVPLESQGRRFHFCRWGLKKGDARNKNTANQRGTKNKKRRDSLIAVPASRVLGHSSVNPRKHSPGKAIVPPAFRPRSDR